MQAIEWPPLAERRQQRTETHFPVAMFSLFSLSERFSIAEPNRSFAVSLEHGTSVWGSHIHDLL